MLLTVLTFKLLLNLEAFQVQYNKMDSPKIFSHSQNLCLDICDTFSCPSFTFYIKFQGPWNRELFLWGEYFYWFLARLAAVLLQGIVFVVNKRNIFHYFFLVLGCLDVRIIQILRQIWFTNLQMSLSIIIHQDCLSCCDCICYGTYSNVVLPSCLQMACFKWKPQAPAQQSSLMKPVHWVRIE